MKIHEWQDEVYEQARGNGFHDGSLNVRQQGEVSLPQVALKLALIHGEISEALEELRDDPRKLDTYINVPGIGALWVEDLEHLKAEQLRDIAIALDCEPWQIAAKMQTKKPEGFVVELADAVIRVLDLAGALGVDLESAMLAKHDYNKSRPYRHGKHA